MPGERPAGDQDAAGLRRFERQHRGRPQRARTEGLSDRGRCQGNRVGKR